MDSETRSRLARERAEEALIRFGLLAGRHARDFIVIGGLNPDFLAPDAPTPHLGTTDVDILFELGFVYERDKLDFGWLDDALSAGAFTAVNGKGGWQWTGELGEARVRLDLLCDVYDSPSQTIYLPGATAASAQNLRGPSAALQDPVERGLVVPPSVRAEIPGSPQAIRLRFASLGGYIAAKCAAFVTRNFEKDAYDLAFVMMYAPGGPRAAARATASTRQPSDRPAIADAVEGAIARLAEQDSPWGDRVVRQLQIAGDDTDVDQLRADVLLAARQFRSAYRNARASGLSSAE